ncbi:protein MAIN-LIKE 1-like [Telopea speciosissima]|uniref:protein MAIN-LIKE 1-like n=1 Tax=Telopea speciosissima TaxID=54955 RepID=UPI001CC82E82|nr:protein MAIN-LIKE 1-like [Telopea speciosissima]
MITGIPFSRRPVSLTPSLKTKSLEDIGKLLGFKVTSRVILLSILKEWDNCVIDDNSPRELLDQAARSFLLYLVSNVLFCDGRGRTDTLLACFFEDFNEAASIDWGGSAYAHFLRMLDHLAFGAPGSTGCTYVWCYEVLGIHTPGLPDETAPYIPQVTRWGKAGCSLIDELQIRWQPYNEEQIVYPDDLEEYRYACGLVQKWIAFEGPSGVELYLGERVTRQWHSTQMVPWPPRAHMRASLLSPDIEVLRVGIATATLSLAGSNFTEMKESQN